MKGVVGVVDRGGDVEVELPGAGCYQLVREVVGEQFTRLDNTNLPFPTHLYSKCLE